MPEVALLDVKNSRILFYIKSLTVRGLFLVKVRKRYSKI